MGIDRPWHVWLCVGAELDATWTREELGQELERFCPKLISRFGSMTQLACGSRWIGNVLKQA